MKNKKAKLTLIGLFLCLFFGFSALMLPQAEAQERKLGFFSRDPIILPTSPFYFIKEWRRSFVRALTRDPLSKIVLEMDILDEKAGELQKIRKLKPDDYAAVREGLIRYGDTQRELKSRLVSISSAGVERDRDTVVKELFERLAFHSKIFADISAAYESEPQISEQLKNAEEGLAGTAAQASESVSEEMLKALWRASFASGTLATTTEFTDELEFMLKVKGMSPERLRKSFEDLELELRGTSTVPFATGTIISTASSTPAHGVCLAVYDPVCGKDGKTYSNACVANTAGVTEYTKGECEE